jgi:hypothetical protein
MGKVNAYLMDVQEFVFDFYTDSGELTSEISTTDDIIKAVKEEFGSGMAVDAAREQISQIEHGWW